MSETEWILDSVVEFLRSPLWQATVQNFVDANCISFTPGSESSFEHMDIHTQYQELVENLLELHLQELDVDILQFMEACKTIENKEVSDLVVGYVLAMDDFLTFKKMMEHRNRELEYEALQTIAGEGLVEGDSKDGDKQKKKHRHRQHHHHHHSKKEKKKGKEEDDDDDIDPSLLEGIEDPEERQLVIRAVRESLEEQKKEKRLEEGEHHDYQSALTSSSLEADLEARKREIEESEIEKAIAMSLALNPDVDDGAGPEGGNVASVIEPPSESKEEEVTVVESGKSDVLKEKEEEGKQEDVVVDAMGPAVEKEEEKRDDRKDQDQEKEKEQSDFVESKSKTEMEESEILMKEYESQEDAIKKSMEMERIRQQSLILAKIRQRELKKRERLARQRLKESEEHMAISSQVVEKKKEEDVSEPSETEPGVSKIDTSSAAALFSTERPQTTVTSARGGPRRLPPLQHPSGPAMIPPAAPPLMGKTSGGSLTSLPMASTLPLPKSPALKHETETATVAIDRDEPAESRSSSASTEKAVEARMQYLRQQRDRLIKIKAEEREKKLEEYEKSNPRKRDGSIEGSSPKRAVKKDELQGGDDEDLQRKMQIRVALAEKFKKGLAQEGKRFSSPQEKGAGDGRRKELAAERRRFQQEQEAMLSMDEDDDV
eukprot:TRINITY_DN28_c0_g1_i1.p1 TRINITY_DN28_c0_g1~~TRINITY_DN28_c0_g1_i1.p1  ORF type:complete len:659 (-),score=299.18 TRINITY_DN28_c0_g1_i1:186-2162(-)